MPCYFSSLLFFWSLQNGTHLERVSQKYTYSQMHLNACADFFFLFHLCSLFPAFCSQTKLVFSPDQCSDLPLPVFLIPCSHPSPLSVFLPLKSALLTDPSLLILTQHEALGLDGCLVSFCLCSPPTLKSFFLLSTAPCVAVSPHLTSLALKWQCLCPCPCIPSICMLQRCSYCY